MAPRFSTFTVFGLNDRLEKFVAVLKDHLSGFIRPADYIGRLESSLAHRFGRRGALVCETDDMLCGLERFIRVHLGLYIYAIQDAEIRHSLRNGTQ